MTATVTPLDSRHQGVHTFASYTGPLSLRCQVLVVGSGPGGAVVAKELAEAGLDVILVEEGPPLRPADFRQELTQTMNRMIREGGVRSTRGNVFMPTLQAIGLGGGTLVNSAICLRAPGFILDKWSEKSGVDLSAATLAPHYERIERFWQLEPTAEAVMGPRNLLFKKGCDALGISSEPIVRNTRGCRGSGECFTGCRNEAKVSTDLSYVPAAVKAGARVYSSIRCEALRRQGRKITGISGRMIEPFSWRSSHEVTIDAEHVVMAAGCLATPVIMQKSGVGNRWVGQELQFHPGLALMGVFPEPVHPWRGATQGYHSLQFLEQGFKLEVLWGPPAALAVRFPGFGHEFQQHLLRYDYMAPFDVICAAEHSRGTVRAKRSGFDPDLRFNLHQADVDLLMKGMAVLSDIAWAAGAVEVLPGIVSMPERLRSKAEAEILRTQRVKANETVVASNHVFGTTRMHADPALGVTDGWGRCHGTENLYIADTGLFPGSPAINPMLTVMALADRVAHGLIEKLGSRRAAV